MQAASRGFDAAVPSMKQALAEFRQKAPAFADRIEAQAARIERFIQDTGEVRRLGMSNQNADAIALVHRAIDPNFTAMVERATNSATPSATACAKGRPSSPPRPTPPATA